jgi:hypothetical protein
MGTYDSSKQAPIHDPHQGEKDPPVVRPSRCRAARLRTLASNAKTLGLSRAGDRRRVSGAASTQGGTSFWPRAAWSWRHLWTGYNSGWRRSCTLAPREAPPTGRHDAEIGVSGGERGAPNLKHAPAQIGAYSGWFAGGEEPAGGADPATARLTRLAPRTAVVLRTRCSH